VRELAAVIERAAILGDGQRLEVAQALGSATPVAAESVRLPMAAPVAKPNGDVQTLNDAMVKHIEQALIRTRGRIEGPFGAAALLHINPHTLRARMRKLGLEWHRFRASTPEA
jgi:DNA-binding NtrC family response regulator